eukprot:gene11126-14933_t
MEDPLDSDDFDPIQYINQKFPTEASLDDLDTFIVGIGSQISALDEEISKAVQTQSVVGNQASKDIEEAKHSIEELFGKIHDIKLKASQSETMVQEICADIKKLDYAKNHLQTSITALNRLQMLINAVDQLEDLAKSYQYKEVANLLDAVKQFMLHFEKYSHITMISDMQKRVENIRKDLTVEVNKSFKGLAQLVENVADIDVISDLPGGGLKSLADSCLVVDALGGKVRKELLEEFVRMQLVSYENLFSMGKQHFPIEQVDRRWAWFKRQLKWLDSKFSTVFPAHWRVQLRFCLEFVERTKIHLITMLTDLDSRDSTDVHTLLKALQSALRFEVEMNEKFNVGELIRSCKESEEAKEKLKIMEAATHQKLKKDDKLMYVPTDHNAINEEDETESGFLALAHASIVGGISGVFDKFLGPYVLLERQNLEELLTRLSQEEDTTSEGVGMSGGGYGSSAKTNFGNVYGSSSSMFVFIKNSIKRCTALTTGQTFLSLSKEFKACMQQYVELLRNRCPQGSGNPPVYKIPPGGEVGICYIVNTGEYCADVVPQLEQMVIQKMSTTFADKVDFNSETEAFLDLVAFCLKVLVSGVMDRLDPAFRTMQSINWGGSTQVGEESPYLHMAHAVLAEMMPKIKETLSTSYFNNFCTKLASEVLQKYLDIILKQKRITEEATQQLLLDTYNIKTMMLQLHQLGNEVKSNYTPSAMYLKLVNSKIAHVEMILKLVATSEDMLVERFRLMWPEGSPADLQMLMTLKGTKRTDQQVILEMLGLSAAGKMLNKTATTIGVAVTTATSSNNNNSFNSGNNFSQSGLNKEQSGGGAAGYAASAAVASISLASSSMRNLTQDISLSARSAVGNLKWSTNKNNG